MIPHRLRLRDYILIAVFGLVVFGFSLVSGKPLSIHEARLPQLASEMADEGRWLLPHSGGRPWLERPPLPHIVTRVVGLVVGRLDEVWIVRIPNVLAGTGVLLCCGVIASRLFGRKLGLLAPLVLGTMYEFYTYASQAEDDIYLALLVALALAMFVKAETDDAWQRLPAAVPDNDAGDVTATDDSTASSRITGWQPVPLGQWALGFIGNRPISIWLFFLFAGMSSLAKGPGIGVIQVASATGAYVLLSRSWRKLGRYVWLWGWLMVVVLSVAWPLYAWSRYPSVWDNWVYDFTGPFGHRPPWYYAVQILGTMAPWTPLALWGLLLLLWQRPSAVDPDEPWQRLPAAVPDAGIKASPAPGDIRRGLFRITGWQPVPQARLMLLCFLLAPLIVMSLPARKHHHYLVPILLPWAIAAAIGLAHVGRAVLSAWHRRTANQPEARHRVVLAILGTLAGLLLLVSAGSSLAAGDQLPGQRATSSEQHAPPILPAGLLVGASLLAGLALMHHGARRARASLAVAGLILPLVVGASAFQWAHYAHAGRRYEEMAFALRAEALVPPDGELYLMASGLDFMKFDFYMEHPARVIHNITWLLDESIEGPVIYVIAPGREEAYIDEHVGEARVLHRSGVWRPAEQGGPWALFEVELDPARPLYPAPDPQTVTVMQVMERAGGPYVGPRPEYLPDEDGA